MPGSETMGMDMTEQTARAEDAAAPAEAAPLANQPGPTQPDPEAHAAELKDRLLRTLAEMENLRKRTDREIADFARLRRRGICARRAGRRRQHAPGTRRDIAGTARKRRVRASRR